MIVIFIQTVFIAVFILYIVNFFFIFNKGIINLKAWKITILVLNGIALIFSGSLLYYMMIVVLMMNNDRLSSVTGVNFLFIGLVLYFFVLNIVLSILVIRKRKII